MAVIGTPRLGLYELSVQSERDVVFMRTLLNEPSFIRNIGDRGVRSLEDARAYLSKGPVASYQANGFGLYRVQLEASGDTIGVCGLVKRATLDHVDLGYALLPGFWGNGYAVESARAVLADARDRLAIDRILAITDPRNVDSERVLGKLDFRFERMVRLAPDDIELKLFAHQPAR